MATARWKDVYNGVIVENSATWESHRTTYERTYVGQSGWEAIPAPDVELVAQAAYQRALNVGPWAPIYNATMSALTLGVSETLEMARSHPEDAFRPLWHGEQGKPVLAIDLTAQHEATRRIRELLLPHYTPETMPGIYGEESPDFARLDFTNWTRPLIFLDMVDGTDELEQGTEHWCAAATMYDPLSGTIAGSIVAGPDGTNFFAFGKLVGMSVTRPHGFCPKVYSVARPSRSTDVSTALLATCAPRGDRLMSLVDNPGCRAMLAPQKSGERGRTRTEGGNPAIVRMIDPRIYRRPEAVFEQKGQFPHDWVPAANIVMKAGGTVIGPAGVKARLGALVCQPSQRARHIVAANPGMAKAVGRCLGWTSHRRYAA